MKEKLIEEIKNIRIWQRGDERAPHKPLLLLYTLGRVSRGESRMVPYSEAGEILRGLLNEFGPYRKAHRPNYPFVKLCNDGGFWELGGRYTLNTLEDWSDRELIDNNTIGGFTEGVYALLRNNRELLNDLARFILDRYFPIRFTRISWPRLAWSWKAMPG